MSAMLEAHSEGACMSYMKILGATPIDDRLASEEVICTFFLTVGDCTGLLGVTLESISGGEIETRHYTGEQGAPMVGVANQCTNDKDHK